MKKLHNKVNIVPVIAKADCLTKKEIESLKTRILKEIENNGIKIYPLPDCDSDEDEEYKEQVRQLKEAVPFAVCGSTNLIEVKGKKVCYRIRRMIKFILAFGLKIFDIVILLGTRQKLWLGYN